MSAAVHEFTPCPLNRSELKLIQGHANGQATKDVAFMIGITVNTADDYLRQAKQKASARSLPHLVAISLRHGWVE